MKKNIFIIAVSAFLAAFAVFFPSCNTVKEIPDDLSAAQLIQLGQDAYGNAQYKNAELYYSTVISRYGMNNDTYIEAKYELGHLYLKQKDYTAAYDTFKKIVDLYASSAPGTYPGAYSKLAQIEMAKIPENKLPKTDASIVQPPAVNTAGTATDSAAAGQDTANTTPAD
jgi:outer membrane protein assembly factor BamD (BamD/ComL family)